MFVKRKHLWITASFDPENKNIHLVIAIFKLSWKENILIHVPNVKQNVENFHTQKISREEYQITENLRIQKLEN